eukprot:3633094-Pyramimonas_sp.AAC.1
MVPLWHMPFPRAEQIVVRAQVSPLSLRPVQSAEATAAPAPYSGGHSGPPEGSSHADVVYNQ